MYLLAEDMSDIYAHPLPRVFAIFLFAIDYSAKAQPPQHTTTGAPMSSTSGYMGAKYVQEFGPNIFDMSSCPKGSHLQRGDGFLLSDGSSQGGYNYGI